MTKRDPLFYWRESKKVIAKTCTRCSKKIKDSEKFIKVTINGEVTYRHDRKCV